jgi:hypothetical protein
MQIITEALDIELTIKNWDEQLRDRIARDRVARTYALGKLTSEELVNWFAQWDPTKAKKYLINWILPRYVLGGINGVEDLEAVRDDLANFDRFKQRMLQKDILKIKSAAELSMIVRTSLRPPGSAEGPHGAVPPSEVQAAHAESIKVYEDEELLVVIPLTQQAAGFWGRYSNWCTAYGYQWSQYPDRNSWFDNYNALGQRLLIWYNKQHPDRDSSNYQCYYGEGPFDDGSIQIMDLEDLDVTNDYPIEDYIAKLSHEQIQTIVDNCMAGYKQDPCSIVNGRIVITAELADIIADFGNRSAEYVYRMIINGTAHEYVHVETSLEHIIDHEIPIKIHLMLEAYLDKKYPDSMEEYNSNIYEVLHEHAAQEHEVIDELTSISYHAYTIGVEQDMIKSFDSALADAGIMLHEPHNYEGMCVLQGPTVRNWIGHPRMADHADAADGKFINVEEPSYGWEGYDETVWQHATDLERLLST